MSSAWRQHFTYNRFTQIAARAVRSSLKETERVAAEKRGVTQLRYQQWENGKGGEQVYLNPPEEPAAEKKQAVV